MQANATSEKIMPPAWWLSYRCFVRILEIAFVAKDVGTFLEHNGTHQTHNVTCAGAECQIELHECGCDQKHTMGYLEAQAKSWLGTAVIMYNSRVAR